MPILTFGDIADTGIALSIQWFFIESAVSYLNYLNDSPYIVTRPLDLIPRENCRWIWSTFYESVFEVQRCDVMICLDWHLYILLLGIMELTAVYVDGMMSLLLSTELHTCYREEAHLSFYFPCWPTSYFPVSTTYNWQSEIQNTGSHGSSSNV